MRFHLLTVVWGPEFTDRFARITLRSLLAPGNLPDLAAAHRVAYAIHTTAADAERLRADPIFQQVAELVEMRVHVFALTQIDPRNPSSHWILWRRGALQLRDSDDVLITVAADHLFSRGTLLHWAELFLSGHLAIFAPGVQVVLETLVEEIDRKFSPLQPLDVPLDTLRGWMFRHLHPVKISMLRGSPRWISHPEEHLRAVRGYGFSQNVLTSHAVAFRPRAVRMNANFCPVEALDRVAFEPCRYLSLEPALKHVSLYLHPWQMDERTLSHFGEWGETFFFEANLIESRATHFYSIATQIPSAERRRAECAGRFFVGQMHASRWLFRLWQSLKDRGRHEAARWLATGHIHARLRRRLALRAPATVFVPAERALARITQGERARLLDRQGRRLIGALRAHVADGRHRLARGQWLVRSGTGPIRTADGSRYSVAAQGAARIIGGPIELDGVAVYIVDRPLTAIDMRPPLASDAWRLLIRRLRLFARRGAGRVKATLLRLLQRNQRLFRLAVGLRDVLDGFTRAGAQAPAPFGGEIGPGLAAYRRALALRVRDAIGQLYAFYQTAVLAGAAVQVPPAARVGLSAIAEDRACDLLAEIVRRSPRFGEAWLELGFSKLEAAEPEAAFQAFQQARLLPPVLKRTRADPDPRVVAALECARQLVGEGRHAEALAVLEAAPAAPPVPWTFHDLRAMLLLQAGRTDEALDNFDRCMSGDHVRESHASLLPRDLAMLESVVVGTDAPFVDLGAASGPKSSTDNAA